MFCCRVPFCRRLDNGYERKGSLGFYVAKVKTGADPIRHSTIAMMIGFVIRDDSVFGVAAHSTEYRSRASLPRPSWSVHDSHVRGHAGTDAAGASMPPIGTLCLLF